jgi:hypothetical protein
VVVKISGDEYEGKYSLAEKFHQTDTIMWELEQEIASHHGQELII